MSPTDDGQYTTTRRTILGAAAVLATITATASRTRTDSGVTYSYPKAEMDLAAAEAGAPMLSSRTPTLDELADYLGVPVGDLATLSMAGRFRGDDADADVELATALAEELHTVADEVEASAVEAETGQ